ncbi:MAG: hypothetical protein EOO45_13395, partial [Flavobacterium sp.]
MGLRFRILTFFLLLTVTLSAQEELRPQPAPVTYAKVTNDELKAKQERVKAESERKLAADDKRKLESVAVKNKKDTMAIKNASR